jgi:hypothetical protein
MAEQRKRERRNWRSKPGYPFFDSDGNWVTSNRRRVVDRRVSGLGQTAPSQPVNKQRLRLYFHDAVKEISPGAATALILGRKVGCDIEVPASQVSREHARVEYLDAGFVLVDQSTNGTYVRFDDGKQAHVLNDRIAVQGSGIISLGKPIQEREADLIYFWCSPFSTAEK